MFPELEEAPEHLSECPECQLEWELHKMLQHLKAPTASEEIDEKVLSVLQERGLLGGQQFGLWEKFWSFWERALPPVAALACLLFLLWMGRLVLVQPGDGERALPKPNAEMWSQLPDAAPSPALPGAGPSQEQTRVVRSSEP